MVARPKQHVCNQEKHPTPDSGNIISGYGQAEELYDLRTDRECMNNLAGNKEYAVVVQKLRSQLEAELRKQNDPRMFGKGYIFDNYPITPPRYMNYYENYIQGKNNNEIKLGKSRRLRNN
jgi:N-sulfoglucosamine sulfohydrolase